MNAISSITATRWLLVCLCVLLLLPVLAGPVCAGPIDKITAGLINQSSFIFEWAADRAHLIQLSLVIVTIGIVVMWWYR